MRRRDLVAMLPFSVPALLRARGATAQEPPPVIGFLALSSVQSDAILIDAFKRGLRKHGRVEGRNVVFEPRSAEGDPEQAARILDEMANRAVALLIAPGPAAIRLAARRSLRVVAVGLPDAPGDHGLFQSLAKPGGLITGFSYFGEDLARKRVELIRDVQPGLGHVGVLHNGTDPTFTDWGLQSVASARQQGLKASRLPIATRETRHIRGIIEAFRREGGQALIVIRDFLTVATRDDIIRTASDLALPIYAEEAAFVSAGAMMSYGADIPDLFERAAGYAARILAGERPGDLPIQLPSMLRLAINTRIAAGLGISIPTSVLASADDLVD